MPGWFPRPTSPEDVRLFEPRRALSAREIFDLFTTEGQEWLHKVGVAGRADGSGKSSTRLLAVDGWVFKTDLTMGAQSWEAAEAGHHRERGRGLALHVWHPKKSWAAFRAGETFYPLTVCPELTTLRSLDDVDARLSGWTDMLRLALRVASRCGLGLDLNPANFGREEVDGQLYYLDDEFYAGFSEHHLAGAIAARIPEEPQISLWQWKRWGTEIGVLLAQEVKAEFARLVDAVRDYPLTEQFAERRGALIEGMRSALGESAFARGRKRDLVCVFADVHANLPALEAVLAEARRLGATRYLFLGDAVGYGPHPKECIARLAELPGVVSIKGNHDDGIGTGLLDWGMNGLARRCAEWTLDQLTESERSWLNGLPLEHREGGWLAVHGAPRDPRRLLAYVYDLTFEDNLRWLIDHDLRLCFHGHSHVQTTYAEFPAGPRRVPGPTDTTAAVARAFLINPGSVGQPRDHDPRAAFGLFEPLDERWHPVRVAYPVEQTLRDIDRCDLPHEAGRRLLAGA